MNKLKHYDGYLTFSRISAQEQNTIKQTMALHGLDIDVNETSIEFTFKGRDMSDLVVQAFVAIASVLKDAEGEVRCEIDDEEQDPCFEFYTIANSQLWRQDGQIVRSDQKLPVVCNPLGKSTLE